MDADVFAVHAAIIAINDAIDHNVATDTVAALENPAAHIVNIVGDVADVYQAALLNAKMTKAEIAHNKVGRD